MWQIRKTERRGINLVKQKEERWRCRKRNKIRWSRKKEQGWTMVKQEEGGINYGEAKKERDKRRQRRWRRYKMFESVFLGLLSFFLFLYSPFFFFSSLFNFVLPRVSLVNTYPTDVYLFHSLYHPQSIVLNWMKFCFLMIIRCRLDLSQSGLLRCPFF